MKKLVIFLLVSLFLICGIEGCAQENAGEINESSFSLLEEVETSFNETAGIQENISEEKSEENLAEVIPEPPSYISALMGLVTPAEVRDYLKRVEFENNTFKDLKGIHEWLFHWMVYRYDMEGLHSSEIWASPKEALEKRSGDCEEWATTFLSLAKAYDENVNCFNVILPGHLTTVCKTVDEQSVSWAKIMERYTFFDLKGFMRTKEIEASLNPIVKEDEMRKFLNVYFSEYGLSGEEREILAVFDGKMYKEFGSNDEFIDWILIIYYNNP